ncbi:MAG TPA: tryptophan synthase subunit beta, partial [Anaerolineae bacterium]
DEVIACVGGGSNAIGIFSAFLDDPVKLIGVEAGGLGLTSGKHAARLATAPNTYPLASAGVFQGMKTFVLQNEDGQIAETHSISAGLDYAGIGPEHVYLRDLERVEYTSATDAETLHAFHTLCLQEGIIPALESSHAVADAIRRAPGLSHDTILLVNLSGRGDKDLNTVLAANPA